MRWWWLVKAVNLIWNVLWFHHGTVLKIRNGCVHSIVGIGAMDHLMELAMVWWRIVEIMPLMIILNSTSFLRRSPLTKRQSSVSFEEALVIIICCPSSLIWILILDWLESMKILILMVAWHDSVTASPLFSAQLIHELIEFRNVTRVPSPIVEFVSIYLVRFYLLQSGWLKCLILFGDGIAAIRPRSLLFIGGLLGYWGS